MEKVFEDRYKKLNDRQREAVDTIDGPVLVVAGPGSGKTELLSLRIANILRVTDTTPSSILCLTFTDSGAANMRDRLYQIVGDRAYQIQIYTFHAFAKMIMSEYREYFYDAFTFEPATDIVKNEILDEAFEMLSHANPLSSYRKGIGYAFFADVQNRISLIKKAGYKSDEYIDLVAYANKEVEIVNKIISENWTTTRLNIKDLSWLENIIISLEEIQGSNLTAKVYANELKLALNTSKEENNTEAISKWKIKNIIKIESGLSLKELENKEKIETVAQIYSHYESSLKERQLYDFDDMIIDLRVAISSNQTLRDNLAEQYQYILIDEFQDTSDAQMSIVEAITNHEVNNDNPNICAVGDDDQAIYKFQGAEINNIINFRSTQYKNVKIITLIQNYRSTQSIIDFSQSITKHVSYRLESLYSDIQKSLKQGNMSLGQGQIHFKNYINKEKQYNAIAQNIKESNVGSIAVIARKHSSLKEFSKFLNKENIDYVYTHKSNAFTLLPIRDIINVMKYLASIHASSHNLDYLLPDIINAPYWGVSRADIFNLSYKIKREGLTWLEGLATSQDEKLKNIYNIILQADKIAGDMPIIQFIHEYIEISGLKKYYFNTNINTHDYYIYLEAIRALYEALNEYDIKKDMYVKDINNFLTIYEKYNIQLIINSDLGDADTKVTLLTAHKSKGLEYDRVYIIDADDSVWSGTGRPNNAPVPKYLRSQLTGSQETEDDNLRLLYVAITRARQDLFISYTDVKSRYIDMPISSDDISTDNKSGTQALEIALAQTIYNRDETEILRQFLKDYKMSITHLNNYLNIEEGGPAHFLRNNLLRFPTPMNASAAFGFAIHEAIEMIPNSLKNNKKSATLKDVINKFEYALKSKRLSTREEKKQLERGHEVLNKYYKAKVASFKDTDEIEVNMSGQGVIVNGAHITGNLDYVYKSQNESGTSIINVIDFKTGKTLKSWDKGLDSIEKIKAHRYKYQLMMYKMLIENSHKYKDYKIGDLGLQFVEDEEIYTLYYVHNEEEYTRFLSLVVAVYRSILALDFKETTEYMSESIYDKVTLDQIIKWEDELIERMR